MITSQRKNIFLNEKLQAEFELNGYVCLPMLNLDEINSLRDHYEKSGIGTQEGFYSSSFSTDEALKEKLERTIQELVSKKTKDLFTSYKNLGACFLSKAPGQKGEMPLHQDWTVVDENEFDSITIWIPLQDVSPENGAMQVIPGSHRFSTILRSPFFPNPLSGIEEELKADLVSVNLKAGEAIIFSQALIHASPANKGINNRIAVTYGLIPQEAQLQFYYKNELGKGEKYEVPLDFFKQYNTQIGQKPQIGSCVEQFELKEELISPEMYRQAKLKHKIKKSKTHKMIALFKDKKHQSYFEKEGYLILPLLEKNEVDELKAFYASLNVVDNNRFGFHVSMDGLEKEQNIKVREKLWGMILPKLDQYLENYKPFVASYVVKESNPKGVVPAHQDWSFVDREDLGYSSITCWTTLVDTYLDNGCMGVIKGSHKLMQNHRPSPSPQTPVPLSDHMFSIFPYLTTLDMKAGEVLFFDNRTFHASPPNTTTEVRLAAGVGVTQKDAQLVHYTLKPDGEKKTIQKFEVTEDFFIDYNNASLAKMYDAGESIQGYKLIGELPYEFDQFSSEELVQLMKADGNEFNVPMCEKLSTLFGYDLSGKKQETPKEEPIKEVVEELEAPKLPFYKVYTPWNIVKEVKFRITGK
jgi:ectoine hydroxylase-related dioxygenase (phytanoyl-CoA dioxygenase family)